MTKLADFSQKFSELWTDTTDSAVKSINKVTTYSSDRFNDITEQAKTSLEDSFNQADNFGGYFVNSMQTRLNSFFHDWFLQHPFVFWLYQHPIITVISTFIIGVILWRLLAALAFLITTTIDKVWLWIFRSPMLFFQSLFGEKKELPAAADSLEITINPTQFKQIINQLDQIQAQQKSIIQEINNLKKTHPTKKPNLLIIDKTQNSDINS